MGILLGLLTALSWGGADFIARFATRRIGTLRAMFYMQSVGFLLLTIVLCWLGGWGHLADGSGWEPWAWGFLAGCINAGSGLALYRAFEIGKMAVVAGGEKAPDGNDAAAVRGSGRGMGWAIIAATGFGVLFWLLGVRMIPRV